VTSGNVASMRATVIHGTRDVRLEEVPDPRIEHPTDAVVRVTAACVCGSDLWPYRDYGDAPPRRIGHELVGIVEEVGPEVSTLRPGQFVIAPFVISDGTCVNCRNGFQTSCLNGGGWGGRDAYGTPVDGGQGDRVRVPVADGTLVATPEVPDDAQLPDLLALSDVMGTGHHAARAAGVTKGSTVVVVGDGAVGQCAVLASRRLGAERVVIMSRNPARQELARHFGATDVVAERGDEGSAAVRDLFEGVGAAAVLECVGTGQAMRQAFGAARPGGMVGYVGLPQSDIELNLARMFRRNVGLNGGVAPVRAYLPELLSDVLDGSIDPGRVFDLELPLERVPDAYAAMDSRSAVKVMLRP
jgi:threonine dehydrogenase-like Zn-dependent dehydrogenase